MKIVCISDTHGKLSQVNMPAADLLIFSGDWSSIGTLVECNKFNIDLGKIKHLYKYGIVVINGNHDALGETDFSLAKAVLANVDYYIQHETIVVNGIRIFGSAYTPEFCNWYFGLPRGKELKEKWNTIPSDTELLITHGPPYKILDETYDGLHVGCEDLLNKVLEVKPKYHIFGHIHHSYGIKDFNGTTFVNASICNEQYRPVNKPIIIEI